jgi:hypothetical protein
MAYGATGAWTGIVEQPIAWIMFLLFVVLFVQISDGDQANTIPLFMNP